MKRTPMKRSAPLRDTSAARASAKVRKCPVKKGGCGQYFTPLLAKQIACGPDCAGSVGKWQAEKDRGTAALKAAKEERAKDRATRERLKRIPDLITEAQDAFNKYIRLRDQGKGCIVCGDLLTMGGIGGGFDAGHVRARSVASHLRFNELNVHGQCKPCNAPGGTLPHVMREAAIKRIGEAAYLALENDNKPHKWQHDELRAIRDGYRAKARELEKQL